MPVKPQETKKVRGIFERPAKSGIWWVCYFVDGKKKREKVGRKSDAIALYHQRKADARAGVKLPSNMRHKGEKLSALIDRAIAWYASHKPKSLKGATTHLEAIKADLGDRVAADLKPSDVDNWISKHKKWSPATMNRYKATLGRALQLAVVSGDLEKNVARLVTARKENNTRVRWLKDDEEQRMVVTIKKNCPLQLPAFIVALHTGMRQSEQFGLTWDRVDLDRKRIRLTNTKNGSDRDVPMNKTCYAALKELYDSRGANEHVFQSTRYKRVLKNPRKWFETVMRDAKVHDLHWHDLRHSFCSRLVMAGVNLRTVMELAGHKSIEVTTRYAHLAPEHNQEAIERLVGFKGTT